MKNIKNKKRYARIGGVAGLVSGIGTVWLFNNPNGYISIVIGSLLIWWGVSNVKK